MYSENPLAGKTSTSCALRFYVQVAWYFYVHFLSINSTSEWLANRITLRTKKGARLEIASFSEWLASRNRELFRMARELENAAHKEKARE